MRGAQAPDQTFDWDRLRVFRAVARAGSMSAAADRLGGSLPTVSRRIADLEVDLRAELFFRSPTGVTLTSAGKQLLRHVDLIADTVEAAQWELSDRDRSPVQPLHIVCCEALAAHWIAPRLARFIQENPAYSIRLSVSDEPTAQNDLSADICIQHFKPQQPEIISKRLGRAHHLAFTSRGYPDGEIALTDYTSVLTHGCLAHTAYISAHGDDATREARLTLMRPLNSLATIVALCRAGLAPAILPYHFTAAYPELVPHQHLQAPPLDIWMAYTVRTRSIKHGAAVTDWLARIFSTGESTFFRQTPPGKPE